MLGNPIYCPGRDNQATQTTTEQLDVPASATNPFAQISNSILERNSCVLRTIVELVNGSLAYPAESAANPAP